MNLALKTPTRKGREGTFPLPLAAPLDAEAQQFWEAANKQILWGWQRHSGGHRRLVYYSARLMATPLGATAVEHYFHYEHCTVGRDAKFLSDHLRGAMSPLSKLIGPCRLSLVPAKSPGYLVLRFIVGIPSPDDEDRVRRLRVRRPRKSLGGAEDFETNATHDEILPLLPVDLYLGSGVSYEAGLPTLCQVHDWFCLDDHENGCFTHGNMDRLPLRLKEDPSGTFRDFCSLHVKALTAKPTEAQCTAKELIDGGHVGSVFSDNVDNMLSKLDIPFTRTRGSGVFNERFPATFTGRGLIVVGVAADRRQIIRQARAKRLKVVVVNACTGVALNVQHLNYVRSRDLCFRTTADKFFKDLKAALARTQSNRT